jgi:hypothetical protein
MGVTPMLTVLISTLLVADPGPSGLNLSGVVVDSKGLPLPQATVFIRTAGPRQGVGVL